VSLPIATIEKLAFGGNGVCRIDGKVCFVPFSCPGDEVSLQITANKKSYCIASISEVISSSSSRAVPVCSVFGDCGGCNWQHISYPVQLEHKQKILAETLWRGARVPEELVENSVPAVFSYGYRGRLQFKVSFRGGKLRVGFFRHGSHEVVDTRDGCPVALPVVNQVLNCFRDMLQSYPGIESVSQLSIDTGDSGVIVVIHQHGKITAKNRSFFVERTGDFGPCTGLFLQADNHVSCEKIWGSPEISYSMSQAGPDLKPVALSYHPGGFAQVHQLQNSAMLAVVRRLGEFKQNETLLDLYCGNGNFSLPLASEVVSVVGVEASADSIAAAEHNRKLNNISNAQFFCDDVTTAVNRLVFQGITFSTVLLDPPRSGAGEAIAGIVRLMPNKILYVSCDPSTLARDCGLLSGLGYAVVKSVPVDMFPQTYHIESITLLSR
jgi:23S rRNA (uracil1939-C5)-methyltransferase